MNSNEVPIQRFIKCLMALSGFQRGKDYTLRKNRLKMIKHPQRGKIISVLKELYPQYNYYWETPKTLIWY